MAIKEIKAEWSAKVQRAMFATVTYEAPIGKCVVVMENDHIDGKWVVALVQVATGRDLFDGMCRPCDNRSDGIDVAGEMISDNYDKILANLG